MANRTDEFMELIRKERDRQRSLPGSEYDSANSVNDWIAISGHYLNESAKRRTSASFNRGSLPTVDEYENSLVKAAAVILAALEHSIFLQTRGDLK